MKNKGFTITSKNIIPLIRKAIKRLEEDSKRKLRQKQLSPEEFAKLFLNKK